MASTEFCIKWTNYQANIVSSVGKLRSEDEFVDVTLVCDDKNITAHKVILSACSDYFKEIFKTTPCSQHMVLLPNIQYEDMMSLVQYMYTGQVFIHQDMLGRLLKTAQQLQVKGLIEQNQNSSAGSSSDENQTNEQQPQTSTTISSRSSPLLLSPYHQLTPPPSVSPSSSASSLPSPGKHFPSSPLKIPSPPTSSFSWTKNQSPLSLLSSQAGKSGPLGSLFTGSISSAQETKPWSRPAAQKDDIVDIKDEEMNDETDDELVIDTQGDSKDLKETTQSQISSAMTQGSLNFESNTGEESGEGDANVDVGGGGGGGHDGGQQQGQVTSSGVTHPRQRWRCMQPRLCNYCWKTFSNSFNLKQHIVNVHIQSQGVNCNICDKVVKNKWYLRKHLVTAHGAPLKRSKTSDHANSSSNAANVESPLISSLNGESAALTMTN